MTPQLGAAQAAIGGVCAGAYGHLFYSLETPEVSGIFRLSNYGEYEQRILHTADFRVRRLSFNGERLALVVAHGGTSSIGVMNADGSEFAEVTQGD